MFAGNVYGHLGTPVHPLKDPAQRGIQFFRYPEDLSVEAPSDLEVGHLKRDKITVTFSSRISCKGAQKQNIIAHLSPETYAT